MFSVKNSSFGTNYIFVTSLILTADVLAWFVMVLHLDMIYKDHSWKKYSDP